jgi:hemerythrin superfamily protein
METVSATQLLRNDHKVVKGLFRQSEAVEARAPEMKQGVVREICALLTIHARIEEDVFYPALRENPRTAALIANSYEDHREAMALIETIEAANREGHDVSAQLSELISAIETHVETEETELFPVAEKVIASKLEMLGQKMFALKQQLLKSPYAHPGLVQDPNGGEQMRKSIHG